MFASVLIANRGEIACRIIRTARALGMQTIALHSPADRAAMHVRMADESIALGGSRPEESYLDIKSVVEAVRRSGAQCVHPGYGFLAENAEFAEACAQADTVFVGPPASAIRAMGQKDDAKRLMRATGVPVLPGFEGEADESGELKRAAAEIGYPVMIKAVAGGGGTGMRRVAEPDHLEAALEEARREARSAFGDPRVILEKCLDRPRHIEVQVLADSSGNCVHLYERDCSLQRRNQKVIEESPAPGMPEELRETMTAAALSAAKAVGYTGAGTVEFLVEQGGLTPSSNFYFLEMNTRLQVEHPVTEEVTGLDLVEWQFRVAAGEPLGFSQKDIQLRGHAIEARLYAEDPARDFVPSSGPLHLLRWPDAQQARVETGVEQGDVVSPFYDPMLAKIICAGEGRQAALKRLKSALGATAIAGPKTNLAFLNWLLDRPAFREGVADTGLISRAYVPEQRLTIDSRVLNAGVSALLSNRLQHIGERRKRLSSEPHSPWARTDGFSLGGRAGFPLSLLVNGRAISVRVSWENGTLSVAVDADGILPTDNACDGEVEVVAANDRVYVLHGFHQTEIVPSSAAAAGHGDSAVGGSIVAPMHGRVVRVRFQLGDTVAKGDVIAVLEAMKMEHRLLASCDGVLAELPITEGAQVSEGDLIAALKPADDS